MNDPDIEYQHLEMLESKSVDVILLLGGSADDLEPSAEYGQLVQKAVSYHARLSEAQAALDAYNAAATAEVTKKTKRGHKTLDLKQYLPQIDYTAAGEELAFDIRLPCGSGEALNLNPALLMDCLHGQGGAPAWQCQVLRTHLYTVSGQDFA